MLTRNDTKMKGGVGFDEIFVKILEGVQLHDA